MEPRKLDDLHAHVEVLATQYARTAEDPLAAHDDEARRARHEEQMAELDRLKASLDPAKLQTTVAQVRRWAAKETHPNWFWAAYADLAQRLDTLSAEVAELRTLMHEVKHLLIVRQMLGMDADEREAAGDDGAVHPE